MENQTKKITLLSTLSEKFTGHIAGHSFRQLLWQLTECAVGVFFGALLISPEGTLEFIRTTVSYSGYAPLKVVAVVAVYFHRKFIHRKIRMYTNRAVRLHSEKDVNKLGEKLIDGIPVSELVDYLVRRNAFTREGVNGVRQTFGLNMEKFNGLAKKLEENQVLVRGENNGRILAPHWTLQSLNDYLSGAPKKSADLLPHFKVRRIGGKERLDKNQIMA